MPNGPSTVQPQTVDYDLTISACKIDEVIKTEGIPDQNYIINSGELVIPSHFVSAYNCPLEYELTSDMPPGTPASVILDPSTGTIKVLATDLSLSGQQFTFDLKATSV